MERLARGGDGVASSVSKLAFIDTASSLTAIVSYLRNCANMPRLRSVGNASDPVGGHHARKSAPAAGSFGSHEEKIFCGSGWRESRIAALSDQPADSVTLPRLCRKESATLRFVLKRRLVLSLPNSICVRGEDELRARNRELRSRKSTKPHTAWLNDSELSLEPFAPSSDNIYNGFGDAGPCLCRKTEKENTSRHLPIRIH